MQKQNRKDSNDLIYNKQKNKYCLLLKNILKEILKKSINK